MNYLAEIVAVQDVNENGLGCKYCCFNKQGGSECSADFNEIDGLESCVEKNIHFEIKSIKRA